MERTVLLSAQPGQARLAVLEDGRLAEYSVLRDSKRRLSGNIYVGRVRNIAPSLNAAFVDIGLKHNALLPIVEPSDGDREDAAAPRNPRPGDALLIQVVREPDGNKGPRATMRVSVPGRLIALTPTSRSVGLSRKIIDPERRAELRALAERCKPQSVGWIFRTAAADAADEEILQDAQDTEAAWRDIERRAITAKPPALLLANDDLTQRVARDLADERLIVCHVDDPELYEKQRDAFRRYAPGFLERVKEYSGDAALFDKFNIKRAAEGILDRRVNLPGGGFLLFEPGETLTAIDVNSGTDTRGGGERASILRINKEAAAEIARQIRLRDLGGVILIDFIDMDCGEDSTIVRGVFEEAARADRGKVRVYGFTRRGLLELTRKKVDAPLHTVLMEPCPRCKGMGFVENAETVAYKE
ncbi:MAG: Rne/Rng family ribonuclease [Oscillospiraceae bacterium]|jgi:ribonuclease G|nr:Rne/Rng family ribonuclease [Oscillospiraceae bacterium]